mgnify:CR=1 FL=1
MQQLNEKSTAIDFFMVYQFVKRIATPWEEMDAYKVGLIDDKGKKLRKAKTPEEKKAMTPFDRLTINIKRIFAKFGLGSRMASFGAALLLLKEQDNVNPRLLEDERYLLEQIYKNAELLEATTMKTLSELMEEGPANATGAAVAGTGDDKVHWSRKQPKIGPKGPNRKLWFDDANKWLRERNKLQQTRLEKMLAQKEK